MGPESDQGLTGTAQLDPGAPYTVVPRVLCFLHHGEEVLLLHGAPDKRLWAGRYNGVGGHVERHEDPLQAARREIKEETGLEVHALHLGGVVHVTLSHSPGVLIFCFTAEAPRRTVHPSSEGRLEWVHPKHVPDLPTVEDLPLLLPRLLEAAPDGEPFFALSSYDAAGKLQIRFGDEETRRPGATASPLGAEERDR